ncbi:MAG: ribosomal protein S18-alanine N-acetyltransferase [Lachnospiraceae bacterium]|nr:ribosomal protein S18-alanine N-acetyltransferase [Lachnospiraceae bacterium]
MNTDGLYIREMELTDVERISQLEEETFSMPWSRDAFKEMIEKEDARYYVAELNGQVVGGCGLLLVAGEGNITNVVIDKNVRNQGIGTKLLQFMIDDGYLNGLNAFTLEVRVSNAAAIHVYEKLGFFSEGIRPNFYEKPTEDAMIMWKR